MPLMKKRVGRPDKGHKTTVFNLRLANDLMASLRAMAEAERRTMTNLAALLIEDGLDSRYDKIGGKRG